ncbi:hypothetical protein DQ04_01101000 [Trypanosoma grayi]|uniref:hypothetical protein n=1 Tax=Trypanosoma grayi TaxID=71804 RepID=UPI0004F46D40|nr:hypothetical protein DQ04_01101000 [Trypanosoma grayi]KEG13279.1 hypothetical protein DQ04_01101000 [Trypanosoma grayi]
MPIYNIIARKLKPSEFIVQKVDEGKSLRSVLPFISRKLGIPSMKNYVAFSCDKSRRPVARLDMDIPLEEQEVLPLSYIYISPIDATPKGPDGEELPLVSELKRDHNRDGEDDVPPPPPSEDETPRVAVEDADGGAEQEAKMRAEHEACMRAEHEAKMRAEHEAKMRAEQEEARMRAEQEEARMRVDVSTVHVSDLSHARATPPPRSAMNGFGRGSLSGVQANGHRHPDFSLSTTTEHRVQLNLVPDVVDTAVVQSDSRSTGPRAPGEVARLLAAVAEDVPVHHAVLLRMADLVVSEHPKRPQLHLWSHLQSKLGGTPHTTSQLDKSEVRRRPSCSSLTFAPVGDNTEERLSSGAPAGPARAVVRHWVRLLLDAKPDNPLLFMWSKLEAKGGKDAICLGASSSVHALAPEDPTKVAVLHDIPRSSPAYTVLLGLVDLIFEKKPDAPEMWMWYHLVGRSKSGGSASGRSSAISLRPFCEEATGDQSCASDDEVNDCDAPLLMAAIQSQLKGRAFLPCREGNAKPRTKDVSTQTSGVRPVEKVTSPAPLVVVPLAKSSLPVRATNFLLDRSPRELLQPPHFDMTLLRCRRHSFNVIAECELTPSLASPLRRNRCHALSDSVPYGCSCVARRGRSCCYHDRPSMQNDGGLSERRAQSYELCGRHSGQRDDPIPIPPSDFFPAVPSRRLNSEPTDFRYDARQKEAERAELMYEYNWFLQREAVRNEQLQKEVALLRREREFRDRRAPYGPSTTTALTAEASACGHPEVETPLADPKLLQGSPQPPTELDVMRKRLELLNMEAARSRYLSQSSRSPNAGKRAEEAASPHATCGSPSLRPGSEYVGVSPHFTPVRRAASQGRN